MRRLIPALLFALAAPLPLHAQGTADKAKQAETLIGNGKVVEGMAALDEFVEALWQKAPLTLRNATWVRQKADGVGIYTPRGNDRFAKGEPLYLYAEILGFGWKRQGDLWQMDMAADLTLRRPNGDVLASQKDFQRLTTASRVRNREFMVNFTYTLTGLPAGQYIVETTLRDQVTGKSGSVSSPITIE